MILGKNHRKARESESGLTLIEISIGMVLLGLFVGWATQAYLLWKIENNYERLNDNFVIINQSINEFYYTNNRYPCPADLTLSPNSPSYGEEIFSADPNICGETFANINSNGGIVTGGIPFKDLKISEEATLDPWANKISYTVTGVQAINTSHSLRTDEVLPDGRITIAVSRMVDAITDPDDLLDTLIEPNDFALNEGDIDSNGFGDSTGTGIADAGLNDFNSDGNADSTGAPVTQNVGIHYILNSHGPLGIGATTREATLVAPCTAGTNRDTENCDGDNIFWRGDRGTDSGYGDTVFSDIFGPRYFDDITSINASRPSKPFQYARLSGGTASGVTEDIFTNSLLVAINPPTDFAGNVTQDPVARVDVMGSSGTLTLQNDMSDSEKNGSMIASGICADDGTTCFSPEFFISDSNTCQGQPPGQKAGIYENTIYCNIDYNPGLDVDCGGLDYLVGMINATTPDCR